ncbi:MAG: septal ring lytic transglycosylase RlpA family protein [Litorivicinaceae bacterium]|nr:septal ring lytic transglycosylase RlpA family protein [Litorivicinaceae bacterium]
MIRLFLLFPLLIASGCASVQQWIGADASVDEVASASEEVPDGPPLIASIDVASIPEPKAQPEPLAQYGNPESYEVDGVTYRVEPVGAGFTELGTASWYGRKFHGQLTSSGEPFDMFQFTAAHKTMPIPAWIRVTNVENDQSLVVRVNDRGPFKEDRVLDLSWAAAERLGFADQGTAKVRYEVLTVPTSDAALIANPLAKPAQAIFQVTAVSTEIQAQKVAEQIRRAVPEDQATVRVESNGTGLFRVQVLPITDLGIERAIYEQLVALGWSPQRLIAK